MKAHLQWVTLRPAEADAYKQFHVGDCLRFFLLSGTYCASIFCLGVVQSEGGKGQSPGLSFGFGPYGETYDIRLVKVVRNKEEEYCNGKVRGFCLIYM